MIDLYYFGTPNGKKIAIALEEMSLDYTSHEVDITRNQQFEESFLKISPNNKIPAIVDQEGPSGEPISIFESGAILQYLGRKSGQFYPTDERQKVLVDQWLMWQVGGFGPMLGQNHHFGYFAKEKIEYAITRFQDETKRLYKVLNTQLSTHEYVAGEYSIADMAIFPWVMSHEMQQIDLKDYPFVEAYVEKLLHRPAIQKFYPTDK